MFFDLPAFWCGPGGERTVTSLGRRTRHRGVSGWLHLAILAGERGWRVEW